MKLTRDFAFKLNKSLVELDVKKYSKYFLLAISNAKKQLSSVVEDIDARVKGLSTQDQATVMRERFEILKKFSMKDESGLPIIVDDKINIEDGKQEVCQKEIDALFMKNKDIMLAADGLSKDFEKFIGEEIEIDFLKVKFEYFPEELDETLFNLLEIFRKESPEEILGS
jgi:hypothetical protein